MKNGEESRVNGLIGFALMEPGYLSEDDGVGTGSSGALYVKIKGKVFKVDVTEVTQISDHPNAEAEADKFMQTLMPFDAIAWR